MPRIRAALTGILLTASCLGVVPAAEADDSPGIDESFGPLFGKWRGKGLIAVSVEEPPEKISCRVTYTRSSETVLKLNIRCAGVDFKINATGQVTYSTTSKRFSGRLTDDELAWTLDLFAGRPGRNGIRFGLKIEQAEVDGWLNVNIGGGKSHAWEAQRSTPKGLKQLLSIKFRR
jgi:hypothetical protein